MKINKEKLQRQEKVLAKWKANKCIGVLEACTGFGKTFVAVLAIKEMNQRFTQRTTLVVVPTLYLKSQWESEIVNHNLKNISVMVVNSAVKLDRQCDLLVLDEIHNYGSLEFIKAFSKIKYSFLLGLTATMERSDERHHLISEYAPVIDQITLVEALANGYVSKFAVYNIGIELSGDDLVHYQKLNDQFHRYFAWFSHDFKSAMRALKNNSHCEQLAFRLGKTSVEIKSYAVQFMRNVQARKKFIYSHKGKLTLAKEIIEHLNVKTLTFSETVDFADSLSDSLQEGTSFSYHSKVHKKVKAEKLASFNTADSTLMTINTARALDEGFNVEGVELALICSGTSSSRQDLQRTGRAIRFQEGKRGLIINLYLKDTQDEKWLRARQSKATNVNWVNSLEDIFNESTPNLFKAVNSAKPVHVLRSDRGNSIPN